MKRLLSDGFILRFSSTFSNWFAYFAEHLFPFKNITSLQNIPGLFKYWRNCGTPVNQWVQLNETMSRHSVIYTNVQLTIYKRTCFNGLLSIAHSPFTAVVFVGFLRTVTVAEKLQVEKIYKLNLYTCNSHTSPNRHNRDRLKVYVLLCIDNISKWN